jgi:hypothetical protein
MLHVYLNWDRSSQREVKRYRVNRRAQNSEIATLTPEKRLQVVSAIGELAAQEDERLRQRRADIAALCRDLEDLRSLFPKRIGQCLDEVRRECGPLLHTYARNAIPTGRAPRRESGIEEHWRRAADNAFLRAAPDDAEHPGWPAGTPDGRGGKFRPKDGDESGVGAAGAQAGQHRIILSVDERCEAQYQRDLIECRLAGSPACYAQAMLRYANCLQGLPIPPLSY